MDIDDKVDIVGNANNVDIVDIVDSLLTLSTLSIDTVEAISSLGDASASKKNVFSSMLGSSLWHIMWGIAAMFRGMHNGGGVLPKNSH